MSRLTSSPCRPANGTRMVEARPCSLPPHPPPTSTIHYALTQKAFGLTFNLRRTLRLSRVYSYSSSLKTTESYTGDREDSSKFGMRHLICGYSSVLLRPVFRSSVATVGDVPWTCVCQVLRWFGRKISEEHTTHALAVGVTSEDRTTESHRSTLVRHTRRSSRGAVTI